MGTSVIEKKESPVKTFRLILPYLYGFSTVSHPTFSLLHEKEYLYEKRFIARLPVMLKDCIKIVNFTSLLFYTRMYHVQRKEDVFYDHNRFQNN